MNMNDILAKLPPEALATLEPEERAFIAKETLTLDTLVPETIELEEANLLGLRIFSLLTGIPAEDEEEMSSEYLALSHFEDKELINILKKLLKSDCYKMRKRKAKTTTRVADDNPLDSL